MNKHLGCILFLLPALSCLAGENDRSKLVGAWSPEGAGETRAPWILAAPGDAMHITHVQNDQKLLDIECNTGGRECAVKDSGKPLKVSMWFNGPKLVVMETRGNEVVKRRFHVTGDGGSLELETIPIVP